MKRVIIVGSEGQDGRILYDRLEKEGAALLGIGSRGIRGEYGLDSLDITRKQLVSELVRTWRPDEIYYLAAFHHSSQDAPPDDAELFEKSHAVHVTGLVNILQSIRETAVPARVFYAASSLAFGRASSSPQDEQTPLNPGCVYGITKAAGSQCCRMYREKYGVFASPGFLYNHESPLRQPKFVSQKIIRGALALREGRIGKLVLGDLSARIDWGYAPDFVDAMIRILALPRADDFVIATGETHSVGEFVEIVFRYLGLDWTACVVEDPSVLKRRNSPLVGNPSKLKTLTGWTPSVSFEEMVRILVTDALNSNPIS